MKHFFLVVMYVCVALLLSACGEPLPDIRYRVVVPELPLLWKELLGSPQWRIDWLNNQGRKESVTIPDGESPAISLPPDCAAAVSAWPYWPDREIGPGIFKSAGAIFPFDAADGNLFLSWQGGIDAALFWELAAAYDPAMSLGATPPLPWNFNWPRFRGLFHDQTLNESIRADPWLVDWRGIAAHIIRSGFDKRRLVPAARVSLTVPVSPGPWIGTSPFAAPLLFEMTPVFPVSQEAATWVSSEGLLRCTADAWILIPQ